MKKFSLLIIVNIAVFCTLIVVMEISGQIVYYLRHGIFIFQSTERNAARDYHRQVFEMHPYLAARLRKNVKVKNYLKPELTITTTSKSTRWTGAPDDDSKLIRIAALGGSTTFGTGVTDSETWPALLQAKLGNKFSVVNYGVPAVATTDAIIQLALVVPEIKPDFVILYEGWNDIYYYHDSNFSPDHYRHGIDVQNSLRIPVYKETTLYEKLYEVSAIVRLASKIKGKLYPPSDTYPCLTYDIPDPDVDRIFVRNLKTLKLLSEDIAAYTLFVPQILNYHWFMEEKQSEKCNYFGSNDESNHIKYNAMPRLMDRFNSLMQPICSKNDTKCIFVDSVLKVKWEPDDFIDEGHFSRKGGEKFADIISQVILSKTKEGRLNVSIQNDSGEFLNLNDTQ